MRQLVIINKKSGKNERYRLVEEQLDRLGRESFDIVYTAKRGDAGRFAREYAAASDEPVRIFACGGDGTVGETIGGVYDFDNCVVAPVPIGSGNDFIRSLGVPKENFLDLERLMNGDEVTIDLLMCNDKVSVNSVTIGYDCAVAKNVSKFKKMKLITSSFAYKLSIFYCLLNGRKHNFRIFADGGELRRDGTWLLSVSANGKFYGGGIKCSPLAELDDGKIDFMVIPTVGVFRFVSLLPTFVKGNHIDNPKLDFVRHSKHDRIFYESDEPVDIGIDGEIFSVKKAEIRVLPKAQKIIIPK